jgi:hypothetical protein
MSVTNFSRILYSSESFAKTAPPPCERSPSGFTKMSGWSRTWMSAYSRIALMFADHEVGIRLAVHLEFGALLLGDAAGPSGTPRTTAWPFRRPAS